jgi:cell division protein FtsQ
MIVYLLIALPATGYIARYDHLKDSLQINIIDSMHTDFVTAQNIKEETLKVYPNINNATRREINTHYIEQALKSLDNIEDVNFVYLNDGSLKCDVIPMVPVARIYDSKGSHYINKDGKNMRANLRYHVDVPIIVGQFDKDHSATSLLPLLDYIKNHPATDALVSSIKVDRNRDIIIVPIIRGHVINFGDTTDIVNKWERIKTMYRKVLPVKGWDTYDTISVKWRGQVVATRRVKKLAEPMLSYISEADSAYVDDTETMSALTPEAIDHTNASTNDSNND